MASPLSKNQFLLNFRKNINSQFGEDGIIEKIFEIIPKDLQNHWCVEFGAWNGKFMSNTYHLLSEKQWKGILIEGDKKRYEELKENFKTNENVIPLNKLVGFNGPYILDNILKETDIPVDFDLLSIDIDGNDYHIWKTIDKYTPKLVIIEFNPFIPSDIEFIQPANLKVMQGSSILSMTKLARDKGYKLICINQENAFFIQNRFYHYFNIENNRISELIHYKPPLQIFQLYDGTLVYYGTQALYYYHLPVNFNKKLQILPKFFRKRNLPWWGNKTELRILNVFIRLFLRKEKERVNNCWDWKLSYDHYNDPEL